MFPNDTMNYSSPEIATVKIEDGIKNMVKWFQLIN